ncbi:MAG: Gfo/Idh/MocA family oxidoreductase [Lachnospiraceae bacterium]|nr:Gfo/Idh/MocA family oxidoreductase [Lachnospiraceae bacterium]
MKTKILIVGCGWRSQIYFRAIRNLKEHMEIVGVLMHTKQRAEEVAKETGVFATDSFEEAIALKPDFTILCVPRPVMKEYIIRFMKAQIPVLCETPPGRNVEELNELWQEKLRYNGKVQVAEQYFMQPYYSAVQKIIDNGTLGDVLNVNMSAIHGYHAISIFRKWLGLDCENCTIRGSRFSFPVTKTRDRAGWHETGEIVHPNRDRVELVFENGKTAFFDFDHEQYFSPIRSRSWNIQGLRGEIQNMSVCYLDKYNRPVTEAMHREDDGVYNIDGWSHMYISFRGERIYENPFSGMRINDDEIAVTDMMMRMKKYVETGEDFYSLRDGLQDAYLDFSMEEALTTGNIIETQSQNWK